MSERLHQELDALKKHALQMGYFSLDMLEKSLEALMAQDELLAENVQMKKSMLAHFDEEIEEKCFRLIALYQPMARDMRVIACTLKMITYLTRIGRYGKDIAKVVPELSAQPHIHELMSIPHMGDLVSSMIADCLKAYEREEISYISDISARDDSVDALRHSIFRECITYMMEDPKNITRCTNYVMIARYLERCGDHACKM
ncbi:phosphate signaling complex protein PhoU, partial [Methanothrix sp.]|uniref:phosphate signaling complex protein PhoU n=1 Tax=Methanothrix sp. TaxID=90426 RepID=UPI0034E22B9F